MPTMKISSVKAGAELAARIARKADDGDEVLTTREVDRMLKQKQIDAPTAAMLRTAIAHADNMGDRTVDGMIKAIETNRDKILGTNKDGNTVLDDKEQKRTKTKAGKALMLFIQEHAGDKIGSFKIKPDGEDLWKPRKKFVAKDGATTAEVCEAMVQHFNGRANDNFVSGGGPTRYVIGDAEAKGLAKAIEALPTARAKAVLKALSERVKMVDTGITGEIKRVFLADQAATRIERLAKKLHVSADFRGDPKAPHLIYD